jgi:hypothetical protein
MYRTLGTRGSVFGVASGPYAGKERIVAFRRLSLAAKGRLVDALAGRRQLAPLLRSSPTGTNLVLPAALLILVSLYALFVHGWPAAQRAPLVLAYVSGAIALALIERQRAYALSHEGTTIAVGAYLFPLDIIEARRDGTLHLIPLGGVREAAVVRQGGRPALLLTFQSGTTRSFPVSSEREAESAYAALESAQRTLEKLTYGSDLADAVNLDPFFEVRIDDTWESVAPRDTSRARARDAMTFALATSLGVALFFGRNELSRRARDVERARRAAEIARLEALLADSEREKAAAERAIAAQDTAAAPPRQAREAGVGLSAYQGEAPNSEMVAIVTQLAARARKTGAGLPVFFSHAVRACGGDAACTSPTEAALPRLERRVVEAFEAVLSETIPRDMLPVDLVPARPGTPSLVVEYSIAPEGPEPQAIQMVFDVRLTAGGGAEPRVFRLTMPPPAAPLTRPRDRSLFDLGDHPADADLVYARGFDRLYDEIYGMFFAGPPRVPLPGSDTQELRRTFGLP